ncbi:hypothetical protein MJT46_015120 [Ovis ammon polii x Ovis aries]|nr:hypothetical protein MJT46_015120 [Ovis ammon polii x Ovis aries]
MVPMDKRGISPKEEDILILEKRGRTGIISVYKLFSRDTRLERSGKVNKAPKLCKVGQERPQNPMTSQTWLFSQGDRDVTPALPDHAALEGHSWLSPPRIINYLFAQSKSQGMDTHSQNVPEATPEESPGFHAQPALTRVPLTLQTLFCLFRTSPTAPKPPLGLEGV